MYGKSCLTVVDTNSRCDVCTPHTLRTSTVFEKAREAAGEIQPRPRPSSQRIMLAMPVVPLCIRHRRTYMLTGTACLCTEKLKTFATLSLARLTYSRVLERAYFSLDLKELSHHHNHKR